VKEQHGDEDTKQVINE